jgi:hypothetical protein
VKTVDNHRNVTENQKSTIRIEHLQHGNLEMESENPTSVADQVCVEGLSADEKAMHEGFMREALAMVCHLFTQSSQIT